MITFDDRAQGFFEPYTDSRPVQALDLLSKLGDQPELRLIAGGLLVAGTFVGRDRLVRAGARMIIAHEAATVAKALLKTEIDRTRPRSASNRKEKKPKKGSHTAKEKTSFPSGHSAGAIAAARAFSREFPGTALPPSVPRALLRFRRSRAARTIQPMSQLAFWSASSWKRRVMQRGRSRTWTSGAHNEAAQRFSVSGGPTKKFGGAPSRQMAAPAAAHAA